MYRSRAIEDVLVAFCKHMRAGQQPHQIVSLGAGFDTSYFRLYGLGLAPTRFIEVDFPELLSRKSACILNDSQLSAALGPLLQRECPVTPPTDTVTPGVATPAQPPLLELRTEAYCMIGADLTDLSATERAFATAAICKDVPTLVLSECVLTYLDPQHADQVNRLQCVL